MPGRQARLLLLGQRGPAHPHPHGHHERCVRHAVPIAFKGTSIKYVHTEEGVWADVYAVVLLDG